MHNDVHNNSLAENIYVFDYFGVLISIILGLALTHALRGLAKLIEMRSRVRPYWVQVVWTLNVVLQVLGVWFGMFWWKGLQSWSIEWFLFIAAYAVTMFMWASMLYPPEFGSNLDCRAYFFDNRRWFFGFQLLAVLMDIPETVGKQVAHLRPVPGAYSAFIPILLIITVLGLVSDNRRLHGVLAVSWTAAVLSYLFFTPLSRIVGHLS